MDVARAPARPDEKQTHVQHRGATATPFQMRFERLEQTAEHERQWLELLDRPLEIE